MTMPRLYLTGFLEVKLLSTRQKKHTNNTNKKLEVVLIFKQCGVKYIE